ncbi:MAG: hypothetical protein ACOCX4_09785, partial [Planctomycetota bacterium]
ATFAGEEPRRIAAGIGAGMGDCAYHTCLLLSGYLRRLELGLSRPEEDRIMDRLVAGVIRIGTTGQKGALVRGLLPDGRSFFPASCVEDHILFAHAVRVACESPALAADSQDKLRDIYGKCMRRLAKNDYAFEALSEEEGTLLPDGTAGPWNWRRRWALLHLAVTAESIAPDKEWTELAARLRKGPDGDPLLHAELPAEIRDSRILLAHQIGLSDLAASAASAEEAEAIALLRRKIAYRFQSLLDGWRTFTPRPEEEEVPALDWRTDLPALEGSEEDARARVRETWPAVRGEAEALAPAARSLLGILLAGDARLVEEKRDACFALIEGVPWGRALLAASLAPLPLAHALGHEAGLWEPGFRSTLGATPIGSEISCEIPEGFDPLPEGGPRPDGWKRKRRFFPKLVTRMEEEERQGGRKGKGGGGGKGGKGDGSSKGRARKRRKTRQRRPRGKSSGGGGSGKGSNDKSSGS